MTWAGQPFITSSDSHMTDTAVMEARLPRSKDCLKSIHLVDLLFSFHKETNRYCVILKPGFFKKKKEEEEGCF